RQAGARVIAAAQPLLRLGLGQWIATVPHRGPARFCVPQSFLPTTVAPRSHGGCRRRRRAAATGLDTCNVETLEYRLRMHPSARGSHARGAPEPESKKSIFFISIT